MTSADLASIYAAAFPQGRAWKTTEFDTLLESPHCFLVTCDRGFALGRVILDEAELVTIATHPDAQGNGIGRQCLKMFQEESAAQGATSAFLEVASDNLVALHFYESEGWYKTRTRRGYYTRNDGSAADALLMGKSLT
ncbi:GNAT family N-acetyltransferase [uncultured Shimia sp.]|uniref:GNAT family N-acetyltransferase n=1 Tax=uncultured Shimia sp. TaxID=573152 RepID=UPI002621A84A|nr:GNAT family N-acetyltransferase [uncultured Shimia sp.]